MARLGLHPRRPPRVHYFRKLFRADPCHVCVRICRRPRGSRRDAQEFGDIGCGDHGLRRRIVLVPAAGPDASAGVERAVIETALTDLWYGFGVAIQPHNIMWCFIGVLVGNMVGVLPGMGPLATISILLPLTFGIKPVGAILMLAGVMYGAQYGGAICSILLNLPCHPPHAVTCLDGYPMTKQGRGGVALGLTVMASFVGASWGITEMIFLSPVLVRVALQFGPAEICSLMLLGLLAGSTLARGSPLKGGCDDRPGSHAWHRRNRSGNGRRAFHFRND